MILPNPFPDLQPGEILRANAMDFIVLAVLPAEGDLEARMDVGVLPLMPLGELPRVVDRDLDNPDPDPDPEEAVEAQEHVHAPAQDEPIPVVARWVIDGDGNFRQVGLEDPAGLPATKDQTYNEDNEPMSIFD